MTLTYQIARDAVRAWPRHEFATTQQILTLRRNYIKARLWLGDKWLLAKSVQKKENVQ